MFELTEDSLRAAASWQAFKQGRDLLASGAVVEARKDPSGWQGVVKGGGRPSRVRVVVKSATDLTIHCSCAENQRTGAVCAHAVATGLAVLSHPANREASVKGAAVAEGKDSTAWTIRFPATWKRAMAAGRVSAVVAPTADGEATAGDEALGIWLQENRLSFGKTHVLALQGDSLDGFLTAIVGHPRVLVDGGLDPVAVEQGRRLELDDLDRRDERVVLRCGRSAWQRYGAVWWQVADAGIERLGAGEIPAAVERWFGPLMQVGTVEIPLLEFLRGVNEWQEWCHFPEDSWLAQLAVRPAPHHFRLVMEGDSSRIRARASVCYDGLAPWPLRADGLAGLPTMSGETCWQRDAFAEEAAARELVSAGLLALDPQTAEWGITGREVVSEFLANTLPILRLTWTVEISGGLDRLARSTALVFPRVNLRGNGGDWLSFAMEYRTEEGEAISAQDVRRLLQGAQVSTAKGKVCRLAGIQIRAWEALLADLDVEQQDGGFVTDGRSGLIVEEAARKLAEHPEARVLPYEQAKGFQGDLRPYQKQGVAWLHDRASRFGGAILADDMGLGKTVQTIAWAETGLEKHPDGNILILATTSLLGNWKSEWQRFAPGREIQVLHGSGREELRKKLGGGGVWITSHGTVVRDLAWYLRQEFLAVVVDEASLLRNPDTDQAKAVQKLRAGAKIALTGTPIENSVSDLWALFSWVQPGWLGSRMQFRERFEMATQLDSGQREIALTHLRMKTSPFILRRTKQAVAPELPAKIVIDEFCELLPEQAKLYASLAREGRRQVDHALSDRSDGRARMAVLTTLLRLRQVCCDPKIVGCGNLEQKLETIQSSKHIRLMEILAEALEENRKILVFSQFQKQLLNIEKSIHAKQWACLRLDGQTRNRTELVNRFQSDTGPPIFLISLKAGGYGLNLTSADIVIHLDPWWNPAAEDQATDRAHRIGQLRPVSVYRLLTRGTVEEKVVDLQRKKRALASAIDESGIGDAPGWTMEDLADLI